MEKDCEFETLLKILRHINGELADLLAHLYAKAPDLICEILQGDRLGIPSISPNAQEGLPAKDQAALLSLLRRVDLAEQLLDELARDPDRDFASLITRHRDLARDRLFFPDMRDMTAELEGDCAVLSPAHRDKLQEALADHDLAGRMCLTASPAAHEERNAAWQEFEERFHRLIYYRIHAYPGTRELDQHEKQDVMQEVLMEMLRSACRYDARMASLNTYVTVVADRACYRFSADRMHGPPPPPEPPPDGDPEAAELPAPPDRDEGLEDLVELFPQAMAYRATDPASSRTYLYLLELKRQGWNARAIADQINLNLDPSPPLNENSVNQRWNELKKWLQEEDQREEIFEETIASHRVGIEDENIYRRVLYLKLRGWLPRQIAESCNRDFAPLEPLSEKTVQGRWVTLKRWMAEQRQRRDGGADTK